MPIYAVTIQGTVSVTYDVEAEDKEIADKKAHDLFNNDPDTFSVYGQETVEVRMVKPKLELEPEPKTLPPDADALFLALQNLYADYADYYPSMVENSPAMKAAREILENGR